MGKRLLWICAAEQAGGSANPLSFFNLIIKARYNKMKRWESGGASAAARCWRPLLPPLPGDGASVPRAALGPSRSCSLGSPCCAARGRLGLLREGSREDGFCGNVMAMLKSFRCRTMLCTSETLKDCSQRSDQAKTVSLQICILDFWCLSKMVNKLINGWWEVA